MAFRRNHHSQGATFNGDHRKYFCRNLSSSNTSMTTNNNSSHQLRNNANSHNLTGKFGDDYYNTSHGKLDMGPSAKRRKFTAPSSDDRGGHLIPRRTCDGALSTYNSNSVLCAPKKSDAVAYTSTTGKRDRVKFEYDGVPFMSKDEIESCSPSRKDGIDAFSERHMRYSYCSYLQNLGLRLELPQTTIGTAMVLCHRFFVRRSHASHDRYLVATAALFLAAKSEETLSPLNNVLNASCEIFQSPLHMLPANWFEQYRERVIEAEQMILTTLNFELNVQHPYVPLTSILNKLGYSQSLLVNVALNLVSEGLRSSLWLQFKPHEIAAGAAFLAAKLLKIDLTSYQGIWQEFQTPPAILQDVAQQLMELF